MRPGLLLIAAIILFSTFLLNAQDNYQITYTSSGDEVIEWLIPSNDGNLILAGTSNSLDSDGDGLIIKTDLNGNIIWSKVIGGSSVDQIVKIIACSDGGYVVIGSTSSYGQGGLDVWVTRINEDGEEVMVRLFRHLFQ